jgi:hypothetical protein
MNFSRMRPMSCSVSCVFISVPAVRDPLPARVPVCVPRLAARDSVGRFCFARTAERSGTVLDGCVRAQCHLTIHC